MKTLWRGSAMAYEVVNCGVSGYGTREERIFYEVFGRSTHLTLSC